jgi:hypothetical protein
MNTAIGGVFCTNCGTPIEGEPPIADDLAQRKPCPRCGSQARTVGLVARMQSTFVGRATLTVTPYSETLLAKSQDLIAKGEFSIAVVVAHMACEISAERAISQAFVSKGIEYLEESVLAFLNGYNLANKRIRNLYNAATGREIQKQAFWQAFKESATRRNNAVHTGGIVTKAEAEDSYRAANDLVAYLK